MLLILLLFFVSAAYAQENRIRVDVNRIMNRIPSTIYGSCIEDVNHEIYGGFYGQLIFGESFEEPASGVNYRDWRKYTGYWTAENEYSVGGISIIPGRGTKRNIGPVKLGVEPDEHAKLIYDPVTIDDGVIEADLRFTNTSGQAACLLARVSNAGVGENHMQGYGISITRDGKKLSLVKYSNNNHQLLQQVPIFIETAKWNTVIIVLQGASIKVFINQAIHPALAYDDNNAPFLQGKAGLMTVRSPLAFRNVALTKGNERTRLPLINQSGQQTSDHWDMIATGDAVVKAALVQEHAFHGLSSQTVELLQGTGRAGVANRSLNRWGISVNAGQPFNGWVHLKCGNQPMKVTVVLENVHGTFTYAKQVIEVKDSTWKKFQINLTSNATDSGARFAIFIEEKGKIWIDHAALFPMGDKLFKQLPFRADIGKAIQGEKITFMRYAGSMVNAEEYRFKKMIGDRALRPGYTGHWNKFSTNGFGIEEFLQFCEAAGIEAAFAVNIEETPEDMADMVEYLNGPTTTTWGKKRADNGHPAPYKVKYIEIGNEEALFRGDNAEDYNHYIERFNLLYAAMRAKDTAIKFIHSAWWRKESPNVEKVFRALNGKAAYWDFHPWADDKDAGRNTDKELSDMRALFLKWDPNTTMKCTIFEENGNLHNMQRALGHATTLNAVRRHGDFLLTSCPANALQPYCQNDNGWDQGQIFFTPTQVWGMPPYYAQQMAALNQLPLRVQETVEGSLDVTAACNEQKDTLVLHVVNTDSASKTAVLELTGFDEQKNKAQRWTLAGPLQAENTPWDMKVVTQPGAITLTNARYTFLPYSYTILRFVRRKK